MTPQPAIKVDHVSKKFARSLKRAMTYGLIDIAKAALIPHRFRSEGLPARLNDAEKMTTEVTETRREKATTDHTDFTDRDEVVFTEGNKGNEGDNESGARRTASSLPSLSSVQNPSVLRPPPSDGLRPSEFWALRDVSFDVQPGECVGLIGANGAGKSTLFSILSGIYGPSEGRVEIRGRLQALIALGAGFHPMLSGRENIYINAAILGMNTAEVNRRLDAILDFAEIGDFIDAPVKTYSSGMLVRLGFAVAAHMDPDVMLIDEVLAVGDVSFQQKCARFSYNLAGAGKAVVTVSHSMMQIQSLSQRVVWLDHGRVIKDGPTHETVDAYKQFMMSRTEDEGKAVSDSTAGRPVLISTVKVLNRDGQLVDRLTAGAPCSVEVELFSQADVPCARMWCYIADMEQSARLLAADMYRDGQALRLPKGRSSVRIDWDALPLYPGTPVRVFAGLRDEYGRVLLADSYATQPLDVVSDQPARRGLITPAFTVPHRWTPQAAEWVAVARDRPVEATM